MVSTVGRLELAPLLGSIDRRSIDGHRGPAANADIDVPVDSDVCEGCAVHRSRSCREANLRMTVGDGERRAAYISITIDWSQQLHGLPRPWTPSHKHAFYTFISIFRFRSS